MTVPRLEKLIGIEVYATKSLGVGGVLRRSVEDFVVEEVLVDGSRAKTSLPGDAFGYGVLGSSLLKDRYLLCVLIKRNWDTLSALKAVADQVGVSVEQIHVAGLKDAAAITAQHVTVEGASLSDIQRVNVKDIVVHPVGYFRDRLSSYYLLGNCFSIVTRSINHPESAIRERTTQTIEEFKLLGGAPNFFGHQRFGTKRPITHQVGKAITQRNLKRAAMIFLAKPSPNEHPASRTAREALRGTHDFKQALLGFPKQLRYERSMLRHLAKKPDDYRGAFGRLPRKLCELFVQAYQSYLFNRVLSRRIALGLPLNRAEIGDYVVNIQRSGLPMLNMFIVATPSNLAKINELIQNGKMRLALSLIGFRKHGSQGMQGDIEKEILEEEGVSPEVFRINMMPEISLKGELRTAITPLNDFAIEEITCDSLTSRERKTRMSFMLYRSSYATIVLRELMKPRNLIKAGF